MASFVAVTSLPGWFDVPYWPFGIVGTFVALGVLVLWSAIPNGASRPESELPVGKVLNVFMSMRSGSHHYVGLYHLSAIGIFHEFWHFGHLPVDVVAGSKIVYLDDPHLYLKDWADQKVVMILSEKGRARAKEETATVDGRKISRLAT